MEDSKIVTLYWERSQRAIAETAKKYGAYCYRIAHNILQSREDAEECVNDTYLRTWDAIPPSRPQRLSAFLARITRNLSLNRYEQRHADKRGNGQIPLMLDELQECVPDSGSPVAEDVLLKDLLDRFLGFLHPRTRSLFVLRYWYAYSLEEIAARQGISRENVAVTLFRTREKLKNFLQEEGVSL